MVETLPPLFDVDGESCARFFALAMAETSERSDLNAVRSSAVKSSGCSQAVK